MIEQLNRTMDVGKMKVAELKEELSKRGLDIKGLKVELVERLVSDMESKGETVQKSSSKRKKEEVEETKEEKKEEQPKKKGKVKKVSVDENSGIDGEVLVVNNEVYACKLNQTNIKQNNNKFYIIQAIFDGSHYYTFTRWGRVGENGQSSTKNHPSADKAIKDFEKKFKEKTGNNWKERDEFEPKSGKYIMIDMADEEEEGNEEETKKEIRLKNKEGKRVKPSSLPKPTQELVSLIFSNDMFNEQLLRQEIDPERMPLGKLSKEQIKKGFVVLEKIKSEMEGKNNKNTLSDLSSQFWSIIPHSFGRKIPPIISSHEFLQQKIDLLNVLSDIEIAQKMKEDAEKQTSDTQEEELENPLDTNYLQLKNNISFVDPKDDEHKTILKYIQSTSPTLKLKHLFRIDRESEKEKFSEHDHLDNRKLLWHGTNIAVVSAILKTGLRIMPHSGGRVGRGIYFASENSKSAGYVQTDSKGNGVMFLNEVALGKSYEITEDDPSLRCAPKGYDSVLAQGRTEPDPKDDVNFGEVVVPCGKQKVRKEFSKSMFTQSEYLVYKESQVYMKYLCLIDFNEKGGFW